MPDPNTGLNDDELGGTTAFEASDRGETIYVNAKLNRVYDVNSVFNVLWVPRSNNYDVAGLLGVSTANEFAKIFKQGNAQWLADDDGFSDVLSASWNKDVESPFGVFSFTLRPREPQLKEYIDIMRPGDLVFLYASDRATYNDDPLNGTLLTYGIMSRPTRTVSSENGPDVETTLISGADLGVIFSRTSTVFDQAFAEIENTLFTQQWIEQLFSKQAAGSPLEHVLTLLDLVYNQQATGSKVVAAQWQLMTQTDTPAPLASLIDVTSFVQPAMFGYSLPEVFSIAQSGNVWTLLNSYANKVVNEFFFDVREYQTEYTDVITQLAGYATGVLTDADAERQSAVVQRLATASSFASIKGKFDQTDYAQVATHPIMALVFRQRPYDRDSFTSLPQHILEATEVYQEDVGFSDNDVVNFFRIRFPSMPNEFQELVYGIHVNMQSIHRFGIRRMEAETRFNFGSSGASTSYAKGDNRPQDFSDMFDWYSGLMSTWYAANEDMLSGTITCRYRPEIRCGNRLRYNRKGNSYDFYIQGVSHSFSVEAGASMSTLTLTRGLNIADSGKLVNNLFWKPTGSNIPTKLDPYGRFTAAGFNLNTQAGAVIINQQKDF